MLHGVIVLIKEHFVCLASHLLDVIWGLCPKGVVGSKIRGGTQRALLKLKPYGVKISQSYSFYKFLVNALNPKPREIIINLLIDKLNHRRKNSTIFTHTSQFHNCFYFRWNFQSFITMILTFYYSMFVDEYFIQFLLNLKWTLIWIIKSSP